MIDILLVLLIIFMVVVEADSMGLEAQVSQPPKQASAADEQSVVLFVRAGGVTLNQDPIQDDAELQERLAALFKTRGNRPIFVGGDPDLDFQPVIHVIDVARGVGLDRVALLPRDTSH